jgi:hypothetical protein
MAVDACLKISCRDCQARHSRPFWFCLCPSRHALLPKAPSSPPAGPWRFCVRVALPGMHSSPLPQRRQHSCRRWMLAVTVVAAGQDARLSLPVNIPTPVAASQRPGLVSQSILVDCPLADHQLSTGLLSLRRRPRLVVPMADDDYTSAQSIRYGCSAQASQ